MGKEHNLSTNPESHPVDQLMSQLDVASHARFQSVLDAGKNLAVRAIAAIGIATSVITVESVANPPSAVAETGGYPDSDAADCSAMFDKYSWCKDENNNGSFGNGEQWSPRGYDYKNCTDWAAWRAPQLSGKGVPAGLGNAASWDNNAPSSWDKDATTPEPGDIAQSETTAPYGHVGVVEGYVKNAQGVVTSITVSEYNKGGNGEYQLNTYNRAADGTYPRGSGKKWDTFLDLNGAGKGINGADLNNGSGNGGSNPAKTHMLLDGLDRVQARDTIGEQGWVEETNAGGAKDVATGGGVQLVLDHAGRVWSRNTLGKEGWRMETQEPSAVEIEMGSDGTMMLRDFASRIYAKKYGEADWVKIADEGAAQDIETNGGVMALRNYADQIQIRSGSITNGYWYAATNEYSARELEVGSDGTLMIRNYIDEVYTRKEGDWVRESNPGGAAEIATNGGLRVVRNYAGEIWRKSGALNMDGWQPDAAAGSAVEVQVADDGTRIIRDHINRIYARGMGPNDDWVRETGQDAAKMIAD
ncbi:hypothetical protein Lesp02_29960 [Lentzea sp. NBRC 105346]|uniref:CHAP domain-containing protein n=1 Tax=Lentzea sp. NBRC 105346 TaxID=3032205 RepID=UPI0024A1A6EE|nr:CHAP domain-containing protein [Lentzea sp. NBRC 105346]GLZ30807.1 hypothetical protein Lesp02_29960 [Lentzea sp. NBRC 105346]